MVGGEHTTRNSGGRSEGDCVTLSPAEQSALVSARLGVAYSIVRREFAHLDRDTLDDLRSEAVLGLIEAAANYDPEHRGTDGTVASFATYAYPWVRGRCLSFLTKQQRHWGQEPVFEDDAAGDDADGLGSIRADAMRQVQPYLETLSEKDREIIRLNFGLVDGRFWSHREIGDVYGVHYTRIRQIIGKAMKGMRKMVEDGEVPGPAAVDEIGAKAKSDTPTQVSLFQV